MSSSLAASWDHHLTLLQRFDLEFHVLQVPFVGFLLALGVAVDHEVDPCVLEGTAGVFLAESHHFALKLLQCQVIHRGSCFSLGKIQQAKSLRQRRHD